MEMRTMEGKELWLRIFNTDMEEPVLAFLEFEKDFEDEGTDEENKDIVEALEGKTLKDVVDWTCQYYGYGLYASDIAHMIDILQIKNIEEIKEWNEW